MGQVESKEVESMDDLRMSMIRMNLLTIKSDIELIKIMDPKLRKFMNNYVDSNLMAVETYFHNEEDGGTNV